MPNSKVCILTAGKGSRMGPYSKYFNKAVIPLNDKGIISHIIELFPQETQFVVATGYKGDQVIDYLKHAHPQTSIEFIEVENYDGPGSGPGKSLKACKESLQGPFYFISCDTLVPQIDTSIKGDWVGVANVSRGKSLNYCNFIIENSKVTEIKDKQLIKDQEFKAFIGLMHIESYQTFWEGLENESLVKGELQISNGLNHLINNQSVSPIEFDWIDVGDENKYKEELSKYINYDFSKPDEALYFINGRVIKLFCNPKISQQRVEKALLNVHAFPELTYFNSYCYSYPFAKGETLYSENSVYILKDLLGWLEENLWSRKAEEVTRFEQNCLNFYKEKTISRIQLYFEKYSLNDIPQEINGRLIESWATLEKKIPWDRLSRGIPALTHGDLQFDNILFDKDNRKFTLLDWRQSFDNIVEYGDIYYDYAKLLGGMTLNYDLIKKNLLAYNESETKITFDFATRYSTEQYKDILRDYVTLKGHDFGKVRILTGLIFLNMSPLHHFPFDKMLFALGRTYLQDSLSNE
jgi:choline kinase/thiamine kinase-like enzyme